MADAAENQPRSLVRDRVDTAYAGLTLLVGRGVKMPLKDGITMHAAFTAEQFDGGADAVLLEGQHGALYLDAGVPFLLALTGIDVSAFDAAPAAQREWLEAGFLGRLAGTPLGVMTRMLRRPPSLPPAPGTATLHLSLQDGSHAASTVARADARCLQALLSAQTLERNLLPQPAFHSLPMPVIARIARHALPSETLKALRSGDVIIPDQPDVDVHGEGLLRSAHWLARVRYGQRGTIEFLSLESAMEAEHDTSVPAEQQAETPDLDRTPLQLEFRLGALTLTLGQLRAVAPGGVFQLDGAADGFVSIVCGGQRLGVGEPVDVAGRLGIRITRWDLPC
jgi:type III secretion protein Q